MYHLVTVHFVTNRRTDRHRDDNIIPIGDYTAKKNI